MNEVVHMVFGTRMRLESFCSFHEGKLFICKLNGENIHFLISYFWSLPINIFGLIDNLQLSKQLLTQFYKWSRKSDLK